MSDFRSYGTDRFPPIVKNLIIINVLVYLAQMVMANSIGLTEKLMLYPEMPSQLRDILINAKAIDPDQRFRFYQIFTHMFAHSPGTIFHIIFNMYSLWLFGSQLENYWGSKRFLSFYLLCGVGAAALHLGVQYFRCEQVLQDVLLNRVNTRSLAGAIAPALGASGAVMGIFAAYAFLFPNTRMMIIPIPIPIKVKWLMLLFAAVDLFGGIQGTDNIAHFAHLGGAITGIIMVWIWNRDRRRFY